MGANTLEEWLADRRKQLAGRKVGMKNRHLVYCCGNTGQAGVNVGLVRRLFAGHRLPWHFQQPAQVVDDGQ